ncbi:DUF1330 domain-containing protein [Microbulbifer salipaludis]|uniref:DUF1330 domain-containing protein n=1 Tax=Microbulbifer salipaludis TaxID=187980 RepID=A0ABS3EA88_9GAMM|nr:DUF1330 domain-containing protein [Microbulbifer salipaludis]MBN8432211.1 DUF1330 domain-containing protein [Microbulbifer salipaludis]
MLKPLMTAVCAFSLSGCIYVSVNESESTAHQDTCNEPVYLVQSGSVRDTSALEQYHQALKQSLSETSTSGRMLMDEQPAQLFSASDSVTPVSLVTRFSCMELAEKYWNSSENQQLTALREQAADFQVAVYPKAKGLVVRF